MAAQLMTTDSMVLFLEGLESQLKYDRKYLNLRLALIKKDSEWHIAANASWKAAMAEGGLFQMDWCRGRHLVERFCGYVCDNGGGSRTFFGYHLGYAGAAIACRDKLPKEHVEALTRWCRRPLGYDYPGRELS